MSSPPSIEDKPWRTDLVLVVFGLFLLTAALSFGDAVSRVENDREVCERQNVRTRLQYEKYLADERESRLFSQQQPPGPIRRITRKAAAQYQQSADELVRLVALDNVELEAGSPETDCGLAYPDPFPFNLVGD